MKAVKLKSGNWNIRLYLGRDANGKVKMASITAPTRKEALQRAAAFTPTDYNLTVAEACKKYIALKDGVLSPSTIHGYQGTYRTWIEQDPIAGVKLAKLTTPKVQRWVSDMARQLSPKSVRNNYGFFMAAVSMFSDETFRVTLPQKRRPQLHTPTTAEINKLLDLADGELRKAIVLGAVCMMRRGEISALMGEDIDRERCLIHINKALSYEDGGGYKEKGPKTEASDRIVEVTPEIVDMLPAFGRVVDLDPHEITRRFRSVMAKSGLEPFRFHDLRHYAASIAASSAIGAGTLTIQARGGWQTDHVLKRTYEHELPDQAKKDTAKILKFYTENLSVLKS